MLGASHPAQATLLMRNQQHQQYVQEMNRHATTDLEGVSTVLLYSKVQWLLQSVTANLPVLMHCSPLGKSFTVKSGYH